MRQTKTVIILFVVLAVLNPQLSNVFIIQIREPAVPKSETSDKIFTLTNRAYNLQINEYYGGNTDQFNVTLWITDWKEKTALRNLNVTVCDLQRRLVSSSLSNETGHVDLRFLYVGPYAILVQSGNRTVGYQKINVVKSDTFVIKTWAYDLNITLVDENGKPLTNHSVLLYDQMVFQAPNYTLVEDDIRRDANYSIMTDETGRLVNQNETDENGKVHFGGVWNGTYRIRVLREGAWIEEYVLGKPVLIYREPVSGEYVLDLQEPTVVTLKCIRADLAIKFISASNGPIKNATIYIRNEQDHLFFKNYTNETGLVEYKNIYVIDGLYVVSARYGNRTVGCKVINVAKTEIFTVKCWAYNLAVKCVDQENNPLPDHIVFLYDQLVFHTPTNFSVLTNQTGILVNWTKTDGNGEGYFTGVWNGTYRIRVMAGELIGEETMKLQETESVMLRCNKTYLTLRFLTGSDDPLSNATVYIHNSAGNLLFREYTDQNGYIYHEGIYVDNYTIFVEWLGTEVWSGTVNVYKDKELAISCSVFRLTVSVKDLIGRPLPKADVTFIKWITVRRGRYLSRVLDISLKLRTNEKGYISLLLPSGIYEASCSYGIYLGLATVNLMENYGLTIQCNVQPNVWFLTLFVASPLVGLTLLLERKKLRKPLEIRRYKNMLSKLESMYNGGLVEYRLYRRLREEYEAKLMELGGREIRR